MVICVLYSEHAVFSSARSEPCLIAWR